MRVEQLFLLTKKTHQNFVVNWFIRTLMSQFQFSVCHSFPFNSLTLVVNTTWGWESNLCCNPATHRMRFGVWSLAILDLNLQEMKVSFNKNLKTFWLSMCHLNWETESLSTSFSFSTLSGELETTNFILYHLKIWFL